jgi:hypothetical protein
MKKTARKLSLARETVVSLTNDGLRVVAGGVTSAVFTRCTSFCLCPTKRPCTIGCV